jgi:hypothetical protein
LRQLKIFSRLSSIISTEIWEKLNFENKIWVSEKFSMMFLNVSNYDSYVISDYSKWFLIKWRNFLQFENFQYGLILGGEILRKIKLSSKIGDGHLRLIMRYSMGILCFLE